MDIDKLKNGLGLKFSSDKTFDLMDNASKKFRDDAATLGPWINSLGEYLSKELKKDDVHPVLLKPVPLMTELQWMALMETSFVLGTLYGYQKGILED